MKKFLFKALSVIFGGCTLCVLFICGGIPLMEGRNPIDPYADTEFAPDYSPQKFRSIKKGMNVMEVEKIIGRPLNIAIDTSYEHVPVMVYTYTNDGFLRKRTDKQFDFISDLAWYRSYIEFSLKDSIAIYINMGWSYD